MSEYKKELIPVDCQSLACPFVNNCPQLRTEIVRTRDDYNIDLCFVGQGAGEKEVKLQRPFVGPAGKVLRNEIKPLLDREKLNIILDNTIRARPQDERGKNRAPETHEVDHCIDFLWEIIDSYGPRIVIPLGASATGDLIPMLKGKPISSSRGKVFKYRGRIIIPTYHPAASLHAGEERGAELRAKMVQDIKDALAYKDDQMRLL